MIEVMHDVADRAATRRWIFLFVVLVLAFGPTGCGTSRISWFPTEELPAATTPRAPSECRLDQARFRPSKRVLLGRSPAAVLRWASDHLPHNYRVGRAGSWGLMPPTTPGTVLQARIREGQVAMVGIQSHGLNPSDLRPLSREALHRFLDDAAGCSSYRLCRARQDLDHTIFTGFTACRDVRVPMRIVGLRHRREVIGVAVWLPDLLGEM